MPDDKRTSAESRRKFMRRSLGRLVKFGASLGQPERETSGGGRFPPQAVPRRPPQPLWLNRSPRMNYALLGKTRLMASRFVLNGAGVGRDGGEQILKAVDRGVNLVVSAPNWGDSEGALGSVYEQIRDRAWICSMMRPFENSPATEAAQYDADAPMQFWDDLETSLGLLRAETIDCYFLQAVDQPWRIQDAALLEAMDRAKEQQRVRHFGLMAYRNVEAVVEAALERDTFDVVMLPLNPLNLASTARLIDRAREKRVGLIGFMPTLGIDDAAEAGILPICELPDDMTPREMILQYMFKNVPSAVFLHDFVDEATLERDLDLAIFEPSISEMNELDAVVEEELWPACAACGQHRTVAAVDLEEACAVRLSSAGADRPGERSDSRQPSELLCEECRGEVDAAVRQGDLGADSDAAEPHDGS